LGVALVGYGVSKKEQRISYFDPGLAGGQSRFLVEDPLRDDRFAVLSRGKSSGKPYVPKDGSPMAPRVLFLRIGQW
jgi:hypothetical protein